MERIAADIDGLTISAIVAGAGSPVLLVPGMLMHANRYVDSGLVEHLATTHRVIAIDPLGHGESTKSTDPADYDRPNLLGHMIAVLDACGEDVVDVVGYSRGSALARLLATDAPHRVRTVGLGGVPLFDQMGQLVELGVDVDSLIDEAAAALAANDWPGFWQRFPIAIGDEIKAYMEADNDAPAVGAAVRTMRSGVPAFEPLAAPTWAVWGRDEAFHEQNLAVADDVTFFHSTFAGGHDAALDDTEWLAATYREAMSR